MEKTIAVIVSYNRRQLLSECVAALRNQTRPLDAILVVNNGSTDDTELWLKNQNDIQFITQENVGSSGGFNTAISWAYQNGYSWIWCMDDDGYPKEDALENLLTANINTLCLRNCAVLNKEDKKSFVWNTKNFASIDEVKDNLLFGVGHPFNGTLIHRNIVERVGLPKAALFLWGDETEYFHRIVSKNKIPVCTVSSSIHYHPATAFTYKNDWDFTKNWKMYFYVRNRLHIHKSKFNNKAQALFNYCCFLVAMVGVVLVFQKSNKFKKLGFILWPAVDAFSNNFKQTPQTILQRLDTSYWNKLSTTLNDYKRNGREAIISLFTATERREIADSSNVI